MVLAVDSYSCYKNSMQQILYWQQKVHFKLLLPSNFKECIQHTFTTFLRCLKGRATEEEHFNTTLITLIRICHNNFLSSPLWWKNKMSLELCNLRPILFLKELILHNVFVIWKLGKILNGCTYPMRKREVDWGRKRNKPRCVSINLSH